MELHEFVTRLRDRCCLVTIPTDAAVGDDLYESLGFDSLAVVELLFATETLAGIQVPPFDPPPIRTLADAFEYYELLRTAAAPGS